jgi:hypothetical protein
MPKSMIDEVIQASPNRRRFLKTLGAATAAVTAMGVATPKADAQTSTEVAVLNFALNLEYLEAEFYTYGQYGYGIEQFGIGTTGTANGTNPTTGGATAGGAKVTFSNSLVFTGPIVNQIGSDERAHVVLLRSFLGSAAIAKPNINLAALGIGFGSQNEFLTLSRIFEDIGVSAYAGAAGLLTTPLVITTAARILAAEAEHVATVRTQIARLNVMSPTLDGADIVPPPTGSQVQYLSINPSNGLPAIRTPGQVLYLAFGMKSGVTQGGFFPTGVNGAITMSSDPATAANLGTIPPS